MPRRQPPSPTARFVASLCLLVLCSTPGFADDPGDDLATLARWMTGAFSSAAQAAENDGFLALDLHTTPIWNDRPDGRWLYVEQAVAGYPEQPYRQRVYRLTEVAPGLLQIEIFTLPTPAAFVGAWRDPESLGAVAPEDLEPRRGCEILLRRRGDVFEGSTLATLCPSTLRGATFATSQVVVTEHGLVSWDRGFADDGAQIWGAIAGGYVFDRIVDDALALETETETGTETDDAGGNGDGDNETSPETE